MDVLTLFAALSPVVGAFLLKLLFGEAEGWILVLTRRVVDCAVARLPISERDRYREEWLAHADELPGSLGKLIHAIACYLYVGRLNLSENDDEALPDEVRIGLAHGLTLVLHKPDLRFIIIHEPVLTRTGNPGSIMNIQKLSIHLMQTLSAEREKLGNEFKQHDWDRIVSDIRRTFCV